MYKCNICGLEFDEPTMKRSVEPMPDGFFEERAEEVCPSCGMAYFDEMEDPENDDLRD